MLLTEEEAKTRWCPFARYASAPSWPEMPTIIAPQDRAWGFAQDSYAFPQNCIGSACMAWRKDLDIEYDREGNLRGYCGLAGEP